MTAPTKRAAAVYALAVRLDATEPGSDEALAIYREAVARGLSEALEQVLRASAENASTVADGLERGA
jgi:hypothetical protein